MKCDRCDNEATVHEVTVSNGVKVERNLCEACAAKQGLASPQPQAINELMSKILLTPVAVTGVTQRGTTCNGCKMTFAEFRQAGLLGCPDCYRAFESQLGPLIERAHEGGVQHAGKTPRRVGEDSERAAHLAALAERAERLRKLQEELKQAVTHEEYERAAKLRDELRRLITPSGKGAGS